MTARIKQFPTREYARCCARQSARGNRSQVAHVSGPPAQLICKQTRGLPNPTCQESRAPLLACFDVRPVQDVHPALIDQSAERRCRENKSHHSNNLDFHLKLPPVFSQEPPIQLKF